MTSSFNQIRQRLIDVNRTFAESRKALRDWAVKESHKLDELECEELAKSDAIDVDCHDVQEAPAGVESRESGQELTILERELQEMLSEASKHGLQQSIASNGQ